MIDIVLGSFYGDEGKGQTVHNLCKERKNSIVVRFSGGHQVGHTVKYGKLKHTFSNYGSGTLLGIPTYWSEYCTIDPITTLLELQDLNELGVTPEIIYSPMCQVVTPYDVISQWNNDENLAHGTVGTGFKSTLDRVKAGYSLTAFDCTNLYVLRAKIKGIREFYYKFSSDKPERDIDAWCMKVHAYFAHTVRLTTFNTIASEYHNNLIFEGSQGILLDQMVGVMPHCTPSNTTCKNVMELLNKLVTKDLFYIRHWYVTRPYITRHGNGPLCTDTDIIKVTDPNNKFNDFQKTLRACKMDSNLLIHAIKSDMQFYATNPFGPEIHLRVTHLDEYDAQCGLLPAIAWLTEKYDARLSFSEYERVLN